MRNKNVPWYLFTCYMLVGLMSNCLSPWCLLGYFLSTSKQAQIHVLVSKVIDITEHLKWRKKHTNQMLHGYDGDKTNKTHQSMLLAQCTIHK